MQEKIANVQGIGKICIASFMGTIIEIIGLLFGSTYDVFVILSHFLQVPLMTSFVLGKERRKILQVMVAGYFFTMIINAILEALWNQFGELGSFLFYLLFACGVVIVGVRLWKNHQKTQKGIFQVELLHQGKKIRIHGFYDSGNRLKDPYSGKGVHIISKEVMRRLELYGEQAVLVPYHALGNEEGILEVYYVDELIVEGERNSIRLQNCPVGVTKDNLFQKKNYEIILNEEVF